MSLPPGFLEELRNRVSLSHVVGRKVAWDMRKSNQGKGDMWAPCPFHQEKSASFHVDDRKGFYYCFGCHAKGDAITFIRETENTSFIEAVEILAREAGLPMPERDPKAAERADRRSELAQVMEEAVKHYRLQLKTAAGAAARDYLAGRRLTEAAQDRFGIGFAPDARQGLFAALTTKGVAPELIVEAGLAAKPDGDDQARRGGGQPYDRFRGRIVFPIRDARGRCIGLGGRAMDPNARAKYLNSPETPLFDKGRSLYNHGPAREAAGKGEPLIVAEGYMDVIALCEAGFRATVAPLGTAITEDQLRLLWRIHPEPVIALDGDAAGLRAALRVIDLALPLMEAGQGLRFAILPEGQDPDDLIRARGAPGFRKVLDAAQPMAALLWRRETEGKVFDSPERRATLDKSLRAALKTIRDPSIRTHYGEEMKRLRAGLFGASAPAPRGFVPKGAMQPVRPSTKSSVLGAAGDEMVEERLQEAVILATLFNHPDLVPAYQSELEALDLTSHDYSMIRASLLSYVEDEVPARLREKVAADVGQALEKLLAENHVRNAPGAGIIDSSEKATRCLDEALGKIRSRRAKRAEIEDAVSEASGLADEGLTWRLSQAAEAVNNAGRARMDDANDMGEDREAMSNHLQSLIDRQIWVKNRR